MNSLHTAQLRSKEEPENALANAYGLKHDMYTVWRSLGYLDWAGILTKLLLGREFEPRRGTFSEFHQKSNAI